MFLEYQAAQYLFRTSARFYPLWPIAFPVRAMLPPRGDLDRHFDLRNYYFQSQLVQPLMLLCSLQIQHFSEVLSRLKPALEDQHSLPLVL
jgi:hypothetical protein